MNQNIGHKLIYYFYFVQMKFVLLSDFGISYVARKEY